MLEKESESHTRLTFSENPITTSEMLKIIGSISYSTFGNQIMQLEAFHQKFVR